MVNYYRDNIEMPTIAPGRNNDINNIHYLNADKIHENPITTIDRSDLNSGKELTDYTRWPSDVKIKRVMGHCEEIKYGIPFSQINTHKLM